MANTIPVIPTAQTIAALLPKLHDADPDYRFMSLNDLFQALTFGHNDILLNDYNTAARTCDGVLKTLDDPNGEVQNLAIRCLVPLVQKLPGMILAPLIDKLSSLSVENSVDGSIPAMALRSVVITLPRPTVGVAPTKDVQEAYSAISRVMIPRLVGHLVVAPPRHVKLPLPPTGMLHAETSKEVGPEIVDVFIEVVRCFGPMLVDPEVAALQSTIVTLLENQRASSSVKKRVVVAISILAAYLSELSLSNFISHLIECFRNPHLINSQRRLYITILGSMARSIPQRFGPHLQTLAPFVLSAVSAQELEDQRELAAEDGEPDLEIEEVRESALVALEAFVAACGPQMRSFTEEVISSALRYLKYDPNYVDQDDDDMDDAQSDEDEDFGDDDEFEAEEAFDDDEDDGSWKVRRCAAKVLHTLIGTRGSGDLLDDGTLYAQVAPSLISRFSEREENVRLEIIATMGSLIQKTGEGSVVHFSSDEAPDYMGQPHSRKRRRESSTITFDTKDVIALSTGLTSPIADAVPASGPRADLAKLSPTIIKAVTKLLRGNAIPSKQAAVSLLENMVAAQHGGLAEYFSQIIDPIVAAIKGTGMPTTISSSAVTTGGAASATASTLRIAALRLVSDLAETHSSAALHPYLAKIMPGVVAAAKDRFQKISAEAIGTIEQLIKALTPPRSKGAGEKYQGDIQTLYSTISGRVSANDADVEVRRRAIHALGLLLARTASPDGAKLISVAERNVALELLKDRLKNETTRLSAVRAIDTVAALASNEGQLDPAWIRDIALELASQLRKADRSLRGASLGALKNLVIAPASRSTLDSTTITELVSALLPLVTVSDLHLLGPTLLVFASLVQDDAKDVVTPSLIEALSNLLKAPLGGAVLDAMLILVNNIGTSGRGKELMASLLKDVGIQGDPAAVGKVIGTLLVSGSSTVGVDLDSFSNELKSAPDEANKCLALAVLGEAGLRLGEKSTLKTEVFTAFFNTRAAKVNLAAATALGRAGAHNVSNYLPIIINKMKADASTHYLLLHSIKEILHEAGNNPAELGSFTKKIWDVLVTASQYDDNRAVAAECIGRLAILEPKTYIPQLQIYLSNKTPSTRAMAIQAIRYSLPDADETFDIVLRSYLINMLTTMMGDSDLENRRLSLTTLNSATHNKPDLIQPHLGQLVPLILTETVIKPELVREVMMGPFKHKVDDGLELRKSAYETLYSLMDTSLSRINTLDFFDRVVAGLSDEHDIRALCNLMLTKLVVIDPDETSRRLDSVAEAFRAILSTKLKENSVKQDIEKQEEAVKGVLRVTYLLTISLPGASTDMASTSGQHQIWRTYWEWVQKDFAATLQQLHAEPRADALA